MTDKTPAQEVDVAEVARGLTDGEQLSLVKARKIHGKFYVPALSVPFHLVSHAVRRRGELLNDLGLRVRHHFTEEQNDG